MCATNNNSIKLNNVTLPGHLKKLENKAFANCDKLTMMDIGNSVTEIGDSVFYDCTMLKAVTIPVSVKKIGVGVFDACDALTDIYLYSANPALIGKQVFVNPDCRVYVQTKDYTKYQKSWEENLYVAPETEYDTNLASNLEAAGIPAPPKEIVAETLPGDRVTAAITMKLDNMAKGEKGIIESYIVNKKTRQLARFYPEAKASFSTIAPVKHSHKDWRSNETRVAIPADTIGNFTITGVGPCTVHVETENNYYHEYEIRIFPQSGDANWDGGFDVGDAVNIATVVVDNREILKNWQMGKWMGKSNWDYYYLPGADVNCDGIISVSDASAAVKLALDPKTEDSSPSKIRATRSYDDFDSDALVIGKPNGEIIPIALDNSMEYVALQADIRVPEGMILKDVKAGLRAAGHGLSTRRFDDRTMRVVLFDLNCSAFEETDDPLLQLVVSGEDVSAEDIEIFSIIASDDASSSHTLVTRAGADNSGVESISRESGDYVSLTPEGVLIHDAEGKMVAICTLDGTIIRSFESKSNSELISLPQGIYIVTVDNDSVKIAVK